MRIYILKGRKSRYHPECTLHVTDVPWIFGFSHGVPGMSRIWKPLMLQSVSQSVSRCLQLMYKQRTAAAAAADQLNMSQRTGHSAQTDRQTDCTTNGYCDTNQSV
jgi:hypothetical protein